MSINAATATVLEYGCGGVQWSISLAKRGARCTGLDNSLRQLDYGAKIGRAVAKCGRARQNRHHAFTHVAAGGGSSLFCRLTVLLGIFAPIDRPLRVSQAHDRLSAEVVDFNTA